jgi:steroid delta-isomerase-like uncharacterized protein
MTVVQDSRRDAWDWTAMWSRRDARGYGGLLAGDVIHEDIAQPDDVMGQAANVAELEAFAHALPDMVVTIEHAWSNDRVRVIEYVLSGTQTGEFRGIAPTGKPMTIHALDIDEQGGGKLLRRTTYSNSAEWLRQLGAVPPHKPGPDEPGAKPESR